MAISQAMCTSFKQELLQGIHNFTNGSGGGTTTSTGSGNAFKLALYTSSASLGATTTGYSTSNEITNTSGSAYTAGGKTLTRNGVTSSSSATTAFVDFADAEFTSASFTANGAMIYNTTTDGGSGTTNCVCILAFGGDFTASNGTFTVQFPAANTSDAIIRIS